MRLHTCQRGVQRARHGLSCEGRIPEEEKRWTTHLHARDKVPIIEYGQDPGDQLAGQELENGILRGDVHIVSIR
jgi:hypothetical protein